MSVFMFVWKGTNSFAMFAYVHARGRLFSITVVKSIVSIVSISLDDPIPLQHTQREREKEEESDTERETHIHTNTKNPQLM